MLNIAYSRNKGEYFCRVSTMVHLDGTQILSSLHINLFHYAFGTEQKVKTTLDGIICQKKKIQMENSEKEKRISRTARVLNSTPPKGQNV